MTDTDSLSTTECFFHNLAILVAKWAANCPFKAKNTYTMHKGECNCTSVSNLINNLGS